MAGDMAEPLEDFETWLLHRVAQAVEAAEVSADLLTELQAEFEAARERPLDESEAGAIRQGPAGRTTAGVEGTRKADQCRSPSTVWRWPDLMPPTSQ